MTLQLIEELVLELSSSPTAADSNGVHVFSGDMVKILKRIKEAYQVYPGSRWDQIIHCHRTHHVFTYRN